MGTFLSAAEYAKRRGVDHPAILKAINAGRLSRSVRRHGRGYVVDAELADAELAANTAPGWGGKREKGKPVDAPPPDDGDDDPGPGRAAGTGDGFETYNAAKTRHERLKADLAALDLAEKEGRLVEATAVEREAFRVARLVRDGLLNIPDRVAGELAAETDQFKVHQMLSAEIRRALEGLKV